MRKGGGVKRKDGGNPMDDLGTECMVGIQVPLLGRNCVHITRDDDASAGTKDGCKGYIKLGVHRACLRVAWVKYIDLVPPSPRHPRDVHIPCIDDAIAVFARGACPADAVVVSARLGGSAKRVSSAGCGPCTVAAAALAGACGAACLGELGVFVAVVHDLFVRAPGYCDLVSGSHGDNFAVVVLACGRWAPCRADRW